MKLSRYPRIRQGGVASIVFVLLVALLVAASGTGVMRSIGKSQEINTAVNAVTHAQTGMWAATEAFRRYLELIDGSALESLAGDLDIEMDAAYGSLGARGIAVEVIDAGRYRVSADIVNFHAAARASSAQQVVFDVVRGRVVTPLPANSLNFNHDLDVTGGIEVFANGEAMDLNVDGDVNLVDLRINEINHISATGDVSIDSDVTVDSIYAGGDVILDNTTVATVETRGSVTTTGSATVDTIFANGDVSITSGGPFASVNARGNIGVRTGTSGLGSLLAGGTLSIDSAGPAVSLSSVGDITLDTSRRLEEVATMGNLRCMSRGWAETSRLSANGTISDCPADSAGLSVTQGASNTIVPKPEVALRQAVRPDIDVWNYRDEANYFVEYDAATRRIVVTVNDIKGLEDGGKFTLGRYDSVGRQPPHLDYLCTSVSGSGTCLDPATPTVPLCLGESLYNTCIDYDVGAGRFTVDPNNTAPGVMFFAGDLSLSNGHSVTTFLASGDITTLQQFRTWAANYGSHDRVCQADASHDSSVRAEVRLRFTEGFSAHYPTNLCGEDGSDYTPSATGNIGLAAGGIDPEDGSGAYSGGDIMLGSNTDIVGAVLAGNIFQTQGDVTIAGVVGAGAHGDTSVGKNILGGKTTIDMVSDVPDYDPNGAPVGSTSGDDGSGIPTATLLWVRPH